MAGTLVLAVIHINAIMFKVRTLMFSANTLNPFLVMAIMAKVGHPAPWPGLVFGKSVSAGRARVRTSRCDGEEEKDSN